MPPQWLSRSLFFIFLLYFTAPALAVLAKFEVYTVLVNTPFASLPEWIARWSTVDASLLSVVDAPASGGTGGRRAGSGGEGGADELVGHLFGAYGSHHAPEVLHFEGELVQALALLQLQAQRFAGGAEQVFQQAGGTPDRKLQRHRGCFDGNARVLGRGLDHHRGYIGRDKAGAQ